MQSYCDKINGLWKSSVCMLNGKLIYISPGENDHDKGKKIQVIYQQGNNQSYVKWLEFASLMKNETASNI